jgi:hypothetical protein
MTNVKYSHAVFEHPVENSVGISNERDDTDTWTLGNARRGVGTFGDMGNYVANSRFDCCGNRITEYKAI